MGPKFKVVYCEDNSSFTKPIMHVVVLKQPGNRSARPIMAMDNILPSVKHQLEQIYKCLESCETAQLSEVDYSL